MDGVNDISGNVPPNPATASAGDASSRFMSMVAMPPAAGPAPQGGGQLAVDRTALSRLGVAEAVYGDGAPPGATRVSDEGLRAIGLDPQAFHPKNSDFRAALFHTADGATVLAFKGTTPTSGQDWLNNGQQGLGANSDYYKRAINLAQKVDDATDHHFEITGHSLGGGMAAAAGIVTGAKTTTFNAAGVHPHTLAPFHKSRADADARMADGRPLVDSYIVKGEALNDVQSLGAGPIGSNHQYYPAAGVTHLLNDPHPITHPWYEPPIVRTGRDVAHSIDLHGIPAIRDALTRQINSEQNGAH